MSRPGIGCSWWVDTPVSDAAVSILEEALEELGLPLPSWDTGGDYVIIFGQTRAPGLPVATVTAADGDAVFRLRPTGEPR